MTARPRHVSATHLAARTGLTARYLTVVQITKAFAL